jgi:hypothetical protein
MEGICLNTTAIRHNLISGTFGELSAVLEGDCKRASDIHGLAKENDRH